MSVCTIGDIFPHQVFLLTNVTPWNENGDDSRMDPE